MVVPPTPLLDKPALRRALRGARTAYVAGLPAGERAALEAALAAILSLRLPRGIVAGYHACGSEIAVSAAVFPRVTGAALAFHRADAAALVPGSGGILEPRATAPLVDPDIVLVPLLAVDAHGNRLGQGAGHYDRTLAALRVRRPIFAIGVAWDMQIVDALPADPWDQPLDALVTPSRWLTFGHAAPMSAA